MPTFGELLTAHIERAGIGDADLARRIGITRLTLIRWKGGGYQPSSIQGGSTPMRRIAAFDS